MTVRIILLVLFALAGGAYWQQLIVLPFFTDNSPTQTGYYECAVYKGIEYFCWYTDSLSGEFLQKKTALFFTGICFGLICTRVTWWLRGGAVLKLFFIIPILMLNVAYIFAALPSTLFIYTTAAVITYCICIVGYKYKEPDPSYVTH